MNETDLIINTGTSYLQNIFWTFFWLAVKLLFVVWFVFFVIFFAKKAISYIQQFIIDHNQEEQNVTWFANVVGDVLLYLSIIISGLIWLYILWFQSVYVILWATFATWFVFKELFQNVVSGVLIMTTKEFRKGDLVEIFIDDTIYYGRIEFITLRYTLLRKLDMTRVVIPNKMMTRVPVMTLSAEENVRLKTSFRIHQMAQLKSLFQKIKQSINSMESITQKEFTLITLDSFDNGYLHITAYFYFDPKAGKLRFRVVSEVNQVLSALFHEWGISFSYSHAAYTMDSQDSAVQELFTSLSQYNSLLSSHK
jgi:small conductance mechanosensitive channel